MVQKGKYGWPSFRVVNCYNLPRYLCFEALGFTWIYHLRPFCFPKYQFNSLYLRHLRDFPHGLCKVKTSYLTVAPLWPMQSGGLRFSRRFCLWQFSTNWSGYAENGRWQHQEMNLREIYGHPWFLPFYIGDLDRFGPGILLFFAQHPNLGVFEKKGCTTHMLFVHL